MKDFLIINTKDNTAIFDIDSNQKRAIQNKMNSSDRNVIIGRTSENSLILAELVEIEDAVFTESNIDKLVKQD